MCVCAPTKRYPLTIALDLPPDASAPFPTAGVGRGCNVWPAPCIFRELKPRQSCGINNFYTRLGPGSAQGLPTFGLRRALTPA